MNSHAGDPKELGTFLKARRAELGPHQVGLPATGTPRRVAGLRREEVARLASISTDYYTRVEQGRMPASTPVLEALARALRLTADQRTYLLGLAGRPPADPPAPSTPQVTESGRRLLGQLTTCPAVVLTDTMDVLAWNPLAAALLTDFALHPEPRRNYVWLLFNDPVLRDRYGDWDSGARACVAYLRMNTAGRTDDPRLHRLLAQMADQADFQRWWQGHEVAVQGAGNKHFRHPLVGDLTLDWDTLTSSTAPDQHIVVWTAQPGSTSEQRLHELAAAVATHGPTAGLRDGQPVAPGLE
ncbi:helix-turn-helix domain-containing protein [Streptomyces sp. CBMA156]|uniref:helix-turn-helix domain-containing protein n=1 Tax=Streptomyces sp. CBMA156 TaxID=1930280 RepID=UPI001661D8A8|nr:helix-turn-helix transcriptional regulator [Streptomyces sp. CBMA156]MBD0670198.1 transcriptional regulator [Streptomyces sp. CBMA156]